MNTTGETIPVPVDALPAYKCGGRHIRIRLEDVESAMRRIPTVGW